MEAQQPQQPEIPNFASKIRNPFILAALGGDNTFLIFKYIGGALLIVGTFFMAQVFSGLLMLLVAQFTPPSENVVQRFGVDKNVFLAFAILSFIIGIGAIWVVQRFMHRRTFRSLITPLAKVNYKKIALAFVLYFVFSGVVEYFFYLENPENYTLHFNLPRFLVLVFIVLFLMPFQTSFEELYFRGYLLQGFGLLFRSGWPAAIITAVLFALMHSGNPEVEKFGFWTMFPFYFSFGLMLGVIALVDKGLEIPLAVHAANNMFGSLFLTFEGSALETDALFSQKEMDPLDAMPYYLGVMLVFMLVCSLVFGWWKKKGEHSSDNFV